MVPNEQLEMLVKKQQSNKVIPFLQALSPQERKELAPQVKKLFKLYDRFIQDGNTYRNTMTEPQRIILSYAAFVCYNRSDFAKAAPLWMITKEHLDQILPWYCPTWFSDYINSFRDQEWMPYQLDYIYLLELAEKGYVDPHPHIVARLLVSVIFENRDRNYHFVPEKLEQHPITLSEHIWYLFDYETNVHFSHRYIYFEGKKAGEERSWAAIFQHYSEGGKIDRLRLMKGALLASNRNFNKTLSGWFAGLFVALNPAKAELLQMQQELLLLFSSLHSKVVNTALQSAKAIADNSAFDDRLFLDHAPLLLSSVTKSVVASALQLLEKLGKKSKEHHQLIALLAAQALVHKEEQLQKKAAQLVKKFSVADDELKQAVSLYASTMFSAAKELLHDYLEDQALDVADAITGLEAATRTGILDEDTRIKAVLDVEGLIFLASQAFDNNEPHHFDLVIDALVRLQQDVTAKDAARFEPAFQRALKLFMGDQRSGIGQLDGMLAALFLEFGQILMRRYPNDTQSLQRLYKGFMDKNEQNKKTWAEHGSSVRFFGDWSMIEDRELYQPHRKLLEAVLDKLVKEDNTPLLSTPTHGPCWVEAKTLVRRIAQHKKLGLEYDHMDLQIALSRCWLGNTEEALAIANSLLDGEEHRLMQFFLHEEARPVGPYVSEWAWMVAALNKKPGVVYPELEGLWYSQQPRVRYTGQYDWSTIVEEYEATEHKWDDGKLTTIKVPAKRKALKLELSTKGNEIKKESGLKKWFSKLTGGGDKESNKRPEQLIYEHLRIKSGYLLFEGWDIQRVLFLMPNSPEPLLALAIHKCLEHPTFWSETDKRMVIELLKGLHVLNRPLGEVGHLFVATSLVSSDKTAAAYAAEIWISGVQDGTINSEAIGRIIGIHQKVEFVPLKRLTDIIVTQLMGISGLHNRLLEELIKDLLLQLPLTPVKHLKKLVQIYFELIALNHSRIEDTHILERLSHWRINHTALGKSKALVSMA